MVVKVLIEYSQGRLIALDVTGDFTPVTVHGFYRHYLHRSQHSDEQNKIDPEKALPNNQKSNLEILDLLEANLKGELASFIPGLILPHH